MKWFFRRLYSLWCLAGFVLPMLVFLPWFYVLQPNGKGALYASWLHRWWAHICLAWAFIPYKVRRASVVASQGQACVYCANHSSLLDIVTMGLIPREAYTFVGKDTLTRPPLFGYVFKKFHIPVVRERSTDAYRAMQRASEAVAAGKSVIIFPEGGVYTKNPPEMVRFKDGAFRVAIEQQVPIVPVTLLFNWKLLPDTPVPAASWGRGEAIVHPPIDTKGLGLDDLETLKAQTRAAIEAPLKPYLPKKESLSKV
ncbi:lysophospholipid acyltransferase family protein [Eisenibacter elegans]|jgi:1-acyl-sn-glycerol-3-phosphate acyltransferase|uniref:lysophospholipid acyltransferase family protein n=1 Tax=Eisenibacter elegans TaxID=997 RepID=UPI000411A74B|nr:lysophospholipid acyltransferase family protein [Eisenibacter elegans]